MSAGDYSYHKNPFRFRCVSNLDPDLNLIHGTRHDINQYVQIKSHRVDAYDSFMWFMADHLGGISRIIQTVILWHHPGMESNIWNPLTHYFWPILLYTYIYNIVKSFDICFFRFNNFLKHFRSHFWSFSAQFCSLTFLMLQKYPNATFLNVSQPLKCSKIV